MKKIAVFFPVFVVVCVSFLVAQDVDRGTLNTYDDEGSTGFGAPVPEKPAVKKQAETIRSSPAVQPSEESGSPQGGDVGEDEHFIQSDDYFISEKALATQAWMWVFLSKMVTPSSASTKGEAEFMKIRDGNKVWTKCYYKTAIAHKPDLKLGTVVIAFNNHIQNSVYLNPSSKESSRGQGWFMGKIIDMSDLFKGYVTVAGNYKVSLKNLRIIVN
jgi:hypothetical protein